MPKAKLRIESKYVARVAAATEIVDGKIIDAKPLGEKTVLSLQTRTVADLFEVGFLAGTLPADAKPEVKAESAKAVKTVNKA